jgi:hypothetical protein
MASQALLFSEPSIAETCVWCELSEGIDPAEWAVVCRYGKIEETYRLAFDPKRYVPEPVEKW